MAGPSLPPPPSSGGDGFPERSLGTEDALARVCHRDLDPWWFCSDTKCRFDLPQKTGGTCHLATEPKVAVLEKLGPARRRVVLSEFFRDLVLYWPLHVPAARRLADPLDRDSAVHPWFMTGELSTIPFPYRLPQQWAKWFAGQGFDGMWYSSRNDPVPARSCVALFRPTGACDWPFPPPQEVPLGLLEWLEGSTVSVERRPDALQVSFESRGERASFLAP